MSSWPDVLKRPANDPAFALSTQTLLKLKPARDVAYLRRSIPDLAQFRLAYLLIKAWAKERGIYAAKFGYLGGIHIASMLVPICKMLRHSGATVSTADVIVTFFNYYAVFKWNEKAVLDPFFHKKLMYTRTPREAMCLLGWHAPSLNTALTASPSTTRTISTQIQRANAILSQQGTSWPVFLGVQESELPSLGFVPGRSGAAAFLREFKSYIRIDVQYWGKSRSKGKQFVGWLESRCVIVLVGTYIVLRRSLIRTTMHEVHGLSACINHESRYRSTNPWVRNPDLAKQVFREPRKGGPRGRRS